MGGSNVELGPSSAQNALGRLRLTGLSVESDPDGRISVGRLGIPLARFRFEPRDFAWNDLALAVLLHSTISYQQAATALKENRGPSTFALRAQLRAQLGVEPILRAAGWAGASVRQKGGLTTKEFFIAHAALGEFVRLTVLRGQSHVVDVAFVDPALSLRITSLLAFEETLNTTYDPDGRACRHPKVEDGHCRSGLCWNVEIVYDSEGRPCRHTKGDDGHCRIPLCGNSVLAEEPEKARALDAAIRQVVITSLDKTSRETGVDWREEFGDVDGLLAAQRESGAHREPPPDDLMAKFNDRPLPTTQEDADQLMVDIFSEALGRTVSVRQPRTVTRDGEDRQTGTAATQDSVKALGDEGERDGEHVPITARPVRRSPEEEHLADQERHLADLTEQLATKEAEFATVGAEFVRFRMTYLARFAPLYSEFDRLEAEIARLLADGIEPNAAAADGVRVRAEEAEVRAAESASAAEAAEGEPDTSPGPTADLKALFREVAKAIHPDLAGDDAERVRRTRIMAAASEAYAFGDEAALRRILDGEAARPETVVGDDIGARLVRVLRKIAQVRGRFTELDDLHEALTDDPMWTLFETVRTATGTGENPLGETEADLRARTRTAQAWLAALRAEAHTA